MSRRRVVVTGLGIISPVGNSIAAAWENILAGRSGIGPVTNFDVSDFPVRIAGEIRDFDVSDYIPGKDARRMGAFIHYGIAAASQAIADSGLEITASNATRAGVAIGSGALTFSPTVLSALLYSGGASAEASLHISWCTVVIQIRRCLPTANYKYSKEHNATALNLLPQ